MAPILAQATVTSAGTIDYFRLVSDKLDAFTDAHVGLLVQNGLTYLTALFVIMLFKVLVWDYLWNPHADGDNFDIRPLAALVVKWAVAYTLLTYWVNPLPHFGVPAHRIISDYASYIANSITQATVDTLNTDLHNVMFGLEIPGPFQVVGSFIWVATWGVAILIWFLSFSVTVVSYCILGMGNLIAPIVIPFLLVPSWDWMFNAFIRFSLIYAFWRVFAAGFTYIWTSAIIDFLSITIPGSMADHSTTTIGQMMMVTPFLGMLALGYALCLFAIPFAARDFFSGTASFSANPLGAVASAVKTAVAKVAS